VIVTLDMDYEELKKIYPERFDQSKIGAIFQAWNYSNKIKTWDRYEALVSPTYLTYTYDKLTYLSTLLKSSTMFQGNDQEYHTLKHNSCE